jgi:hypothetical protein
MKVKNIKHGNKADLKKARITHKYSSVGAAIFCK